MKQAVPYPVTEDNFSQCWESIDRFRRKARRMRAIAKLGGFLTNLFFLFSLLFLANGLIYAHNYGSYHRFLRSLPVFPELWGLISAQVLRPGDTLTVEAGKLLLCAYGASAVLFAALALLIALIYHPLSRHHPEGTYEEKTALLAKAAQEAWAKSYATRISTSIGSTILVIIAAFVLFFAYSVFLQDAGAAQALLSKFPTQDFTTNSMLYVLAAYFVCHFFSTILLLLTRFIYRYQFPFDWMVQAEAAALLAKESHDDLSQEALAALRAERAAALRSEAIELEKEAAYQKAKGMLHEAALLGDIPAMEHYARHCILSHLNESARYWLERYIAAGENTGEAKKMLLRLKLRLNHRVSYLRPDAAPLTGWQKFLRTLKTVFTILLRVFALIAFFGALAVGALLLTDKLEISALQDFLSKLIH